MSENKETMKDKCLLKHVCNFAGDEFKCQKTCPMFVGLHGQKGDNGRVGYARIPKEHYNVTYEQSPIREKQPNVYKKLDKYVESFGRFFEQTKDPKTRVKNLYLYSENPGTGKTSTACYLLHSFLIRYYLGSLKRSETPNMKPIYFLSLNSWQKDYNQMTRAGVPEDLREEAGQRYYSVMETAKEAELVVFDDMGTRSVTEGLRNDILDILDTRMSQMKPNIFTSNIPISGLPTLFNEQRLFDRIRDLCVELEFEGESQRGKRQ